MHQSSGFASSELILYPLLFGGGSVLILLFVKRFFLNEKLNDFNSGEGTFVKDVGMGFILVTIYFILFFLERQFLTGVLTIRSNTELLDLMLSMRAQPILLFLWFGPVLWIGIALYEELIRVFMLTELWKFSNDKIWIFIVIVISAALMGVVHYSQGSYGMVTIGIKSLVSGFFFLKYRRLFPLIIAHVLYDGLQVGMLLLMYPS